jgi:hypothetical protein
MVFVASVASLKEGKCRLLKGVRILVFINPLMLELNPSTQHCLMRFFTGDFAS